MVTAAFIGGQVLSIILLVVVSFLLRSYLGTSMQDWIDSTIGNFTFTALAEALTLGVLWIFLSKRRATVASIGFTRPPRALDPAYALIAWAAYFIGLLIVTALATWAVGLDPSQKQNLGFGTSSLQSYELVLIFMSLVIFPPITEEILFRGVLFGGLRKKMSFIWSMLITSVFFGGVHLMGGQQGEGALWIAGIDTMLLSVALCYLREYTGSLWACILLHMLKNTLAYLFLFVLVT